MNDATLDMSVTHLHHQPHRHLHLHLHLHWPLHSVPLLSRQDLIPMPSLLSDGGQVNLYLKERMMHMQHNQWKHHQRFDVLVWSISTPTHRRRIMTARRHRKLHRALAPRIDVNSIGDDDHDDDDYGRMIPRLQFLIIGQYH